MFIGHLPAGYLAGKAIDLRGAYLGLFLVGAVIPDIDMLWFYLIDSGHHHHSFLTHRPIVWALIAIIGLWWRPALWLGLGGLLHCALDTITGAIAWAWPLSDHAPHLVTVPARHSHWILNFLLYWTFLIEIALALIAIWVFLRRRKDPSI